jgi:hypothetical protein
MRDSDANAPRGERDAVPEYMAARDERVDAEVAAYWMATGERGGGDAAPLGVELCTRALHLPDASHEAAAGQRLRIRRRQSTRTIAIVEEPDTGSVLVLDRFAPHEVAAAARPRGDRRVACGSGPCDGGAVDVHPEGTEPVFPTSAPCCAVSRLARSARAARAERVLRAAIESTYATLAGDAAPWFLDFVGDLPQVLERLSAWETFYRGRPILDVLSDAGGDAPDEWVAEVAIVAVIGGLAHWCDEATLRGVVARVAVPELWMPDVETSAP